MLTDEKSGERASDDGVDHLLEAALMDAVGVEELEFGGVVELGVEGRHVELEEPVLVDEVGLSLEGGSEDGEGLAHELVLEVGFQHGWEALELGLEVADELEPLEEAGVVDVELVEEGAGDALVDGLEGTGGEAHAEEVVKNEDGIEVGNAKGVQIFFVDEELRSFEGDERGELEAVEGLEFGGCSSILDEAFN